LPDNAFPSPLSERPLVTVIGEALIDLVPTGPASAYEARPGGSPFNVAVGLARLGVRTSLMARLADNAFGRILRAHAEGEDIDLSAAPHAVEPTTLAVVSIDEDARATYDFYFNGTADWQWTLGETARLRTDTAILHFGSIASWTAPCADLIHAMVAGVHRERRALTSYDPNVRASLLGDPGRARDLIERSISVSNIVKASYEDIEWLYPMTSIDHVAARWLELGALFVVITDGPNGAIGYLPNAEPVRRPGRKVSVADTVGAGDSFTSGLLCGFVTRGVLTVHDLADCPSSVVGAIIDDAILVSSITCERIGADPPTAAALEQHLLKTAPAPTD